MLPRPHRTLEALVACAACASCLVLGAAPRITLPAAHASTDRASTRLVTARVESASTGSADITDARISPPQQQRLPLIDVDPGPLARAETIVSFALPPTVTGESLQLRSTDDERTAIPLQVTRERRAWFIARGLRAGEVVRYRIEPALDRPDPAPAADARTDNDGVELRAWQQPVLRYRTEKHHPPRSDIKPIYKRAGYLHPVRTPTGRIVTDDYPPNHIHHHGIWAAWSKTEFQGRAPDFWNMGSGTGTVEFETVLDTWSGRTQTGFRSRHRYVDLSAPTPTTALLEEWELTLYAAGQGRRPYRMFDLTSTQEMVTSLSLGLPEYLYGSLGFRGPRAWDGAANTTFLTSEGRTRADGHGTRARWCYIGGTVDSGQAGIVILGHPQNYRAPQPMRIHPNEPFFAWAPTQLGRMDIAPGQRYISRYRFIVIDGPPDVPTIERLWQDYTAPVTVRFVS